MQTFSFTVWHASPWGHTKRSCENCWIYSINWCFNWVLMRVIDAVRETIADVSSASPSSEQKRRASTRNVSYCLPHGVYYPHQHSVDTPVCLPPHRRSHLVLLRAGITRIYSIDCWTCRLLDVISSEVMITTVNWWKFTPNSPPYVVTPSAKTELASCWTSTSHAMQIFRKSGYRRHRLSYRAAAFQGGAVGLHDQEWLVTMRIF